MMILDVNNNSLCFGLDDILVRFDVNERKTGVRQDFYGNCDRQEEEINLFLVLHFQLCAIYYEKYQQYCIESLDVPVILYISS